MTKDRFNPNWSDFKDKVKEYNENDLGGIFYYLATHLVKRGDKNKGIMTILLSWNSRAYLKGKRKKLSDKKLRNHIFTFLNSNATEIKKLNDLLNIEFSEENKKRIEELYGKLIEEKNFGGHTGVSKFLHILKPNLFLMWDGDIRRAYKTKNKNISTSAKGYIEFLKEMQKMGNNLFGRKQKERLLELSKGREYKYKLTIPKVLDEYNMMVFKE